MNPSNKFVYIGGAVLVLVLIIIGLIIKISKQSCDICPTCKCPSAFANNCEDCANNCTIGSQIQVEDDIRSYNLRRLQSDTNVTDLLSLQNPNIIGELDDENVCGQGNLFGFETTGGGDTGLDFTNRIFCLEPQLGGLQMGCNGTIDSLA